MRLRELLSAIELLDPDSEVRLRVNVKLEDRTTKVSSPIDLIEIGGDARHPILYLETEGFPESTT